MRKSRNSNQSCPRTSLTNPCSPTHKVRAGLHSHTLLTRGPKPSTPKGETLHMQTGLASIVYAISGRVFHYKRTAPEHFKDIPKTQRFLNL
ncbi:hypothetical protein HanIR_Chr13g0639271 [Helianthus annuus]|nr:hypothetical protein HanIR_Chr13g0639271 [Helianthus annuus]